MENSNWIEDFGENLDVAEIKVRYSPPDKYRVSEYKYEAGERVRGIMVSGLCFVLAGACKFWFGEDEFVISQGEYLRLPSGSYDVESGESGADFVMVWDISDLIGKSSDS